MIQKDQISKFVEVVKLNLPFEANSGQKQAIAMIGEFVLGELDRSVFVLKGYAGTGKTNLMSAITLALPTFKWRSVLLAPTGRAAKVLSANAKRPAFTIHKKIFKKVQNSDGSISFFPADNLHKNTLFIVDEASMINANSDDAGLFGSLLENLFEYVYSGANCKLILIGDTAQLPPVGSVLSPALSLDYLKNAFYLNISFYELTEVARQKLESGILLNATHLRNQLLVQDFEFPKLICGTDVINVTGDELEDALNSEVSKNGVDNVLIVTRSNKRANLFNQNYRNRIKLFEDDLNAGDKLMVVKNNYFWLPESNGEAGFIANGDMAYINKIIGREEQYGFNFCDCVLSFIDYPNLPEQHVKIITNSLYSDAPSLTQEQQKQLYESIKSDVENEPNKGLRQAYIKKSQHYNSLQVKFSYAVTCHKAQGGQWPVVFIDLGYITQEQMNADLVRWLYTAITRATEKVYLINFNSSFFED